MSNTDTNQTDVVGNAWAGFDEFMEGLNAPSSVGGSRQFLKARLYPAFIAVTNNSDGTPSYHVFNAMEHGDAKNMARKLIEANGETVDTGWKKPNLFQAMILRRYRDTHLNTKTPKWPEETWETIIRPRDSRVYNDDGTFTWSRGEGSLWGFLSEMWTGEDSPLPTSKAGSLWNVDHWCEIERVPDPTFRADVPASHAEGYNSYRNDSGNLVPSLVERIVQLFPNKDACLAYMAQEGINLYDGSEEDSDSDTGLKFPDSWLTDFGAGMGKTEIDGYLSQVRDALTSGRPYAVIESELVTNWTLPKEWIESAYALLTNS